jgi:hypothetical protein
MSATTILNHSVLYEEIKEFPDVNEQTAPLLDNPILTALATIGIADSPVFKYSRSPQKGYIHEALQGVSRAALEEAPRIRARLLLQLRLEPLRAARALK